MSESASTPDAAHRTYTFGKFTLDVDRGALRSAGVDIKLRPKSFEMLTYLVRRQGRLISKDELHDALWGHTIVNDDAITQCLIDIRKVIGDRSQTMIRTVPRRGYIFDLPVMVDGNPDTVSERQAGSSGTRINWLRWSLAVPVLLIAVAAVVWFITATDKRELLTAARNAAAQPPSIAVLPFVDMSPEQDQQYFAFGISEEILNLLSRIEGLRVISRTSSFQFAQSQLSIREIASQLNVVHVLEGSVRKAGNTIRITVQLIEASSDEHIWSDIYDRDLNDIFAIQDDVAAKVVNALNATMDVGPRTVARHNPESYALYMQGRHLNMLSDPAHFDRAQSLLLRAIKLDPDCIDCRLELAKTYSNKAQIAGHNDNDTERMYELLDKRLEILQALKAQHPDNSELNAMLGWDALMGDRRLYGTEDFSAAARYVEKAIEGDPGNYSAFLMIMILAERLGRTDLVIIVGEYLISRDPMGFWAHSNLAAAYLANGQLDKAVKTYRTAATLSPNAPSIHWKLGVALLMNGQPDIGLEAIEQEEHLAYRLHGRALAMHDMGDLERSRAAMDELHRIDGQEESWPTGFARAYAYLGNPDEAFRFLFEHRDKAGLVPLYDIVENPYYNNLHDDPRWQLLVTEIETQRSTIEFNPKLPSRLLLEDRND